MFFGITEIQKFEFSSTLCTFFQALHVACCIDLRDSSFTDSSLAVQHPRFSHRCCPDQWEVMLNSEMLWFTSPW